MSHSIKYFTAVVCLLLSVNSEWVENNGLWYYISQSEPLVDYQNAIEKCMALNARLAVITDQNQNNFLSTKVKDGIKHWIGLSNIRTNHSSDCDGMSRYWDTDWHCENGYGKSYINNNFPVVRQCKAISFESGLWDDQECNAKNGYICQWECKRLYLYLKSKANYTGIYNLDRYSNGNIAYTKENSYGRVSIHKLTPNIGFDRWVVFDYGYDDGDERKIASNFKNSYVPYGQNITWVYYAGWTSWDQIKSITICAECELFQLCLKTPNDYTDCYGNFHLTFSLPIPEYANMGNSMRMIYHENSIMCICLGIAGSYCEDRCRYIFPYPGKSTFVKLNNEEEWIFTNMCLQQEYTTTSATARIETSSVQHSSPDTDNPILNYTTTGIPQRNVTVDLNSTSANIIVTESTIFETPTYSSALILDSQEDKTILISALVAVSVLVIMCIVIVAIVIVIRSRKPKSEHKVPDEFNPNNLMQDNNVYIELDEDYSNQTTAPKLTLSPQNETNLSASNKEDVALNKQTLAEDITHSDVDVYPIDVYCNEQPIDGYLAPGYGVLMEQSVQGCKKANNDSCNTSPMYTEVKKKPSHIKCKLPNEKKESKYRTEHTDNMYDSNDDLQLHENQIYESQVSNTENNQGPGMYHNDTIQNHTGVLIKDLKNEDETDTDYYNLDHARSVVQENEDDDDLEIFENSVYEQT